MLRVLVNLVWEIIFEKNQITDDSAYRLNMEKKKMEKMMKKIR